MAVVDVDWLEDRELRLQAAGVAARALRDNPGSLVLAPDPLVRFELLHRSFEWVVGSGPETPVGARRSGCVVGVATMLPPGHCVGFLLPPADRRLDPPPHDASVDDRYFHKLSVTAAHDLDEPHWHIGPVGVEPGFQSLGIGRAVMEPLCERLDERSAVGWLETDTPENVRFYAALGFEVTRETAVLSSPVWFMRRSPPGARRATAGGGRGGT